MLLERSQLPHVREANRLAYNNLQNDLQVLTGKIHDVKHLAKIISNVKSRLKKKADKNATGKFNEWYPFLFTYSSVNRPFGLSTIVPIVHGKPRKWLHSNFIWLTSVYVCGNFIHSSALSAIFWTVPKPFLTLSFCACLFLLKLLIEIRGFAK